MIWDTVLELVGVAVTAAVSENLVFARAFGLGELDYDEYGPSHAVQEGAVVTGMTLLAAFSGWLGRRLVERYFPLPAHFQPPVFLIVFTVLFLAVMGVAILVRKKQGKETSKKRYKLHTAVAFGFLSMGVLLVVGFGAGGLAESLFRGLGAGVGYVLTALLCWSLRERLDYCDTPKAFRGAPILFLYLGLLSLALFGLVGHQLAL